MNKYILLALAALAMSAAPVFAQDAGDVGAGVIIGNPVGITGKYWTTGSQAIDMGLGFSSRLAVYADYLIHSWTVVPQPDQGKLPVYFGLGMQIRAFHDAELGLRAVVGMAYWLPRDPVELFAEIVPIFRVSPDASVGLGGGLGLRYYFGK